MFLLTKLTLLMNKITLIISGLILLFFTGGMAQDGMKSSLKNHQTNGGLKFESESVNRSANGTYTEIIQLFNLTGKAQAIQFRILINKASDDYDALIFKDIEKGSDLKDPGWLLNFNVIKDSSKNSNAEEVFVLLYNSNQNSGLQPGDYFDLVKVNYKTINLPDTKSIKKSSMKIVKAEASTFDGFPLLIQSTKDEIKINIEGKKK